MPALNLSAGAAVILVWVVIFPSSQGTSHFRMVVVLARAACRMCQGKSCFGGKGALGMWVHDLTLARSPSHSDSFPAQAMSSASGVGDDFNW